MNGTFDEKSTVNATEEEIKQNLEPVAEEKKPKKTTKTTKPMNIFQKLLAVENALAVVAKNLTVSTGGRNSYKAVSERDIIDAVKPLEVEFGIYSYPVEREVLESHILESESEYQGKVTRKSTFMTRVKTVYRFVNVDNPSEYIETTVFSEGIDSQDKGSGKAMTYGDKYALMKMYKISTGDDPDQQASEPTRYTTAGTNRPAAQQNTGYASQANYNNQPATQKPASAGGTWGKTRQTQPAGNNNWGKSANGWGR